MNEEKHIHPSFKTEKELIRCFNKRENKAFATVYELLYEKLTIFASSTLYNSDLDASDVVQDIFLSLLNNKKEFDSLGGIKAYVYVSIRHSLANHLNRKNNADKYRDTLEENSDTIELDLIETELYTLVHKALGMLPKDYVKIFNLTLEGLSVSEIATKLGKEKRTIYNQKYKGMEILRKKLLKDDLLTIMALLLN